MATDTKTCRFCGETIPAVGKKCRYCGEYLEPPARSNHVLTADPSILLPPPEPEVLAPENETAPLIKRPHYSSSTFRRLHGWFVAYHSLSLFFLILGAALIALSFRHHAVRYYQDRQVIFWIAGAATLVLFLLPACGAGAFSALLLYKCWDIIQDGHARTRPDKAVALLFVPLVNMYWVFVAIRGLAVDMNAYADRHGLLVRPVRRKLALVYSILAAAATVPGLNVALLVPFLVFHFLMARELTETAAGIADSDAPEPAPFRRFAWGALTLASICSLWLGATAYFMIRMWPAHPAYMVAVPDKGINWLAISPDGSRIVSARATISRNAGVTVWDSASLPESAVSSTPMYRLPGEKRYANNATFSPDGRYLLAIVQDRVYSFEHLYPGELIVWDAETGEQRFRVPGNKPGDGAVECAAFSPDGTEVAAGTIDKDLNGIIVIRDAATGVPLRHLKGHRRVVICLAYSGDGQRIVSAAGDGTVRLWDAANGEELSKWDDAFGGALAVAFSPDSSSFAISNGRRVRVRDAATGKEVATIGSQGGQVTSLAYSPDGRYLALDDDPVRIWDTTTRSVVLTLKTNDIFNFSGNRPKSNESVVVFSADGRRLFASRNDKLLIWDVDLPMGSTH